MSDPTVDPTLVPPTLPARTVVLNVGVPPVAPPTPSTPVTPDVATTQQVAQHQSDVQDALLALSSLPHSLATDEKYLDLQAQNVASWVSAKHMKTRLIEIAAIAFTLGAGAAVLVCHIL